MTSGNMRCKSVWHAFQENQHGTQSHGGLVEMIFHWFHSFQVVAPGYCQQCVFALRPSFKMQETFGVGATLKGFCESELRA